MATQLELKPCALAAVKRNYAFVPLLWSRLDDIPALTAQGAEATVHHEVLSAGRRGDRLEQCIHSSVPSRHPRHSPYWACQLLGWGVYGLSQVYNTVLTLHIPLGRAVSEIALLNVAAICLTHGLRRFMRRRAWGTLRMPALLPRVLAASLVLGLVQAAIMHFMAVAPMWELDPVDDAAVVAALPDILLNPLLLRTLNWSVIFAAVDGPVLQHHFGARPSPRPSCASRNWRTR